MKVNLRIEPRMNQPSWLDLLAGTKMIVFQNLRKPQNYESLVARINADILHPRLTVLIRGSNFL